MSALGFIGLPGMALTGLFLWSALRRRIGRVDGLAGALSLLAALAWASSLALSPGRLLNQPWLSAFWALSALITGIPLRGKFQGGFFPDWGMPVLTWALFLLPALTLVTALFAAPNTYDGLAYHLPRAMSWIQEGGLWPFATHDIRQLFFAPLSEVLQMQMLLLGNGDRLVNLPQWAAYAASGALVFGAARRLGGERAAWLALLALWSAPMAIAESSSTQNDMLCSVFCLASLSLLWRAAREGDLAAAALGGLAAGLACLTKATAYLFMAPWVLALLVLAWRNHTGLSRILSAALLCFTVLQAPYWAQNLRLGAGLIGPAAGTSMESHSPALVGAGVLKQAALHLPLIPGLRDNAGLAVDSLLRALGQDPVDPRGTSYWNSPRFGLPESRRDEGGENWPQLFIWLALCLAVLRLSFRARVCLLLSGLGFLIFCAMVKWQPWAARLHTPGFALASLAIGLGLASLNPKIQLAASLVMLSAAMPILLHQESRPLFSSHSVVLTPRWDQYFRGGAQWKGPVEVALRKASEAPCASVALEGGGDDLEYLLWEGLKRQGRPFEIRSAHVGNASGVFEKKGFNPCLSLPEGWSRNL